MNIEKIIEFYYDTKSCEDGIKDNLLNALKDVSREYKVFYIKQIDFSIFDKSCVDYMLLGSYVIFIPVRFIDGLILGFLLKNDSGIRYYKLIFDKQKPFVYGYQDLFDYDIEKDDKDVIFVVEGIKDFCYIKRKHKYVVACLSSSLPNDFYGYLSSFTNRLVFLLDSDEAGLNSALKYKNHLRFIMPFKDLGVYYDNEIEREIVDTYFNNVLSVLKGV